MILTAAILCSMTIVGAAPAQDNAPPSEKQIRSWIEQLANAAPPRKFRSPADQLSEQDRKALEPVQKAFRQLTRTFKASLPFLVAHLKDHRFSYPSEHPTSGVYQNQTVGDACHAIIQGKLLLTNLAFIDSRDIGVWVEIPFDKAWFVRVSEMSLYEMQVDALDLLLKHSKFERVSQEQWDAGLEGVRTFRKDFVQKGIAVDREFGPTIEGK